MLRTLVLVIATLAFVSGTFVSGTFVSGARAEQATAPSADVRQAILAVIQSQLTAFQRDDGLAAFSHASPGIQAQFQTAERFMAMVRGGYPAVYRPRDVEFLDARVLPPHTAQAVRVVGGDGAAMVVIYFMEQQPDGQWRIDGVQVVPLQELAS